MSAGPRPPALLEGLDELIGHHLYVAYRTQLRRFASIGAAYDIRASQFALLKVVLLNPHVKQTELAKALHRKHANIVTALDELQRRKLLARVRDPNDRRSRVLRLTPEGERLVLELTRRYAELDRELRKKLGAREVDQLYALLARFAEVNAEQQT